jgi:hypothetical protein
MACRSARGGRHGSGEEGHLAERRGSADELFSPVDPLHAAHDSKPAAPLANADVPTSPPLDGAPRREEKASVRKEAAAPPPGRPPPPAHPPASLASPDMTNLSPLHGPTPPARQRIVVPPMEPLPDAAGGCPFDDMALSPTGFEAAEVLSTLTTTKRTAADLSDDDADDDDARGKKLRGSRCGVCANCLHLDCGVCANCRDKPKFGGPGVKKQACCARKCLAPNVRGFGTG